MTRRRFTMSGATAVATVLGGVPLFRPTQARAAAADAASILRTPEDRMRSPFTGFTRKHWLEITERLLAGVLPYLDPESGMPHLPGVPGDRGHTALYVLNPTMARWQAMERIMMLAVYYSAATGRDSMPGWTGSITAPFVKGITRMTDPADPLHCPRINPSVYLGSETALAMMLCPRFFWEPLSAAQKENVLHFLAELAVQPAYGNNHHLFHMVPVPFLERHGRTSNRERLSERLKEMLRWDRGDGWLVDGNNGGFDHYNFWGFQLYLNALCHLDAPWRDQFEPQFRRITAEFLQNARFFFGRDGGPIPWGRSLAYRFADNSAIGWAHLNGASPLPPGQARRMASGCLRYFWDRGALDENGVLELGYHQANSVVAEDYLTDGIGYFAAQGMSCLLIPETDPFWTDPELPLPADGKGGRVVLPGAEMVVRVRSADGEARMFPVGQPFTHVGQWQRGVKYCQHAYSSALGWCSQGEGSGDLGAGRTGYSVDGRNWIYRSHPVVLEMSARRVASYYPLGEPSRPGAKIPAPTAPALSGRIVTHTLIGEGGEIHVFWHTGPQALRLYLGGYGINVTAERLLERQVGKRRVQIAGEGRHSWMELVDGPAGEFAVNALPPRPGWKHSHLFGGLGVYPDWRSTEPVASLTPVVMHVDGAFGRPPGASKVVVQRNGPALHLVFEDNSVDLTLA